MPADLLLVRHGQSEWNAEGRWQGQEDPPLTDLGMRQALEAARAVGAVDLIVASDLARARVTADIIAEALGIGPVEVDARLRERHAGAYQGLTHDEIHRRFPGALQAGIHPDGWEDDADLVARVTPALVEIAAAVGDGGTALVASHSGIAYAMEEAGGQRHRGRLPNLAGLWLHVHGERVTAGERIALLPEVLQTTPAADIE